MFLVGGLVASIFAGRWSGVPSRLLAQLTLGGLLLFGIPELLSDFGGVSEINRVAIAALIPVAIVLFVSARQESPSGDHSFLSAAVAGLGGVLLLLPVTFPQDLGAVLLMLPHLVAAISIAFATVWLSRVLPLTRLSLSAAVIFLVNGTFLLLGAALTHRINGTGLSLVSLPEKGLTLIQFGLLLWLLRALDPRRIAARFLLVPCLTGLEGLVVLRGELTGRSAAGALLCSCASAYLLFARSSEESVTLSLC